MKPTDRHRHRTHERGMCFVQRDDKLCYINIPRSGSTTMKALTWRQARWQIANFYDENFSSYFVFALIRNPYERFLSSYVGAERGGSLNRHHVPSFDNLIHKMDQYWDAHFERQCWFIEDAPLSELIRLEDLTPEILGRLLGRGVKDIPLHNQTSPDQRKDLQNRYTDEMKEFVRKIFWLDFQLWNNCPIRIE